MESITEKDFFISYTQADRHWAEWVAWELEEAGYAVIIQAWDFKPGANFLERMDKALKESGRTPLILAPAALDSRYVGEEWVAAHPQECLIPVRVQDFDPEGLLGIRSYIDLVSKDEEAARVALLECVTIGRAKPDHIPHFPVEHRTAPAADA